MAETRTARKKDIAVRAGSMMFMMLAGVGRSGTCWAGHLRWDGREELREGKTEGAQRGRTCYRAHALPLLQAAAFDAREEQRAPHVCGTSTPRGFSFLKLFSVNKCPSSSVTPCALPAERISFIVRLFSRDRAASAKAAARSSAARKAHSNAASDRRYVLLCVGEPRYSMAQVADGRSS